MSITKSKTIKSVAQKYLIVDKYSICRLNLEMKNLLLKHIKKFSKVWFSMEGYLTLPMCDTNDTNLWISQYKLFLAKHFTSLQNTSEIWKNSINAVFFLYERN